MIDLTCLDAELERIYKSSWLVFISLDDIEIGSEYSFAMIFEFEN